MEKAPRRRKTRVVPIEERKDDSKKSKKILRREAFLLKIEEAAAARQAEQEGSKKSEAKPEMSVANLEKSLPIFDLNWDDEDGGKEADLDPREAEAQRTKAQKKKKRSEKRRVPAAKAMDHWQQVEQHEAFQKAPLAALDEHIANCFNAKILK